MRESERMFFIPPSAGLKMQSLQREYVLSFLLIEDSRYAEEARKEKILQGDGSENNSGA